MPFAKSKIRFVCVAFFSTQLCLFSAPGATSFTIDSTVKTKRLVLISATETALYTGSLLALNETWYKNYPRSHFHFFNDTKEWRGMDKAGHFTTAYNIGKVGISLLKWSGVNTKKAAWYGGALGFAYLTSVEVLDGYSSQWGFSMGDFTANTVGSLAVIGQELYWQEQRISFKYSARKSDYAQYRPAVLGSNLPERLLKDYNGQTYWLSANISSFLKPTTRIPQWLNIAIGYGAEGMTGGYANPMYTDAQGNALTFDRYSQFYLSLDVDFSRIKTKSTVLKTIFGTIGFLKFPFPALEVNKHGISGNWLGW
jgi:Predicted periplasmic lipoprotein (DUF2279)